MPMEGPTILCCNHSNQFMDAMLIIAQCPRPLSFCFAASSFNKPIVGYLAKKINVIPVYRAEDSKMKGKGEIIMTSDTDIKGFKTKFISDIKKNKNFKLGIHSLLIQRKYKLMVEKVIDEENIKVRSDPKVFEILKKEKKLDFYFIPKVDNSLMFKESINKLKEGKAVCIFPEGTSHDRTHLLKLKPGVAYIALEAMANYGIKNIKLISCGFSYFGRDEFRSDLVLEFGAPFEIPESFGEAFKVNKKQAIDLVLKIVESQMKSVILTTPTYNEYMFIKMFRNLYIPDDCEISIEKKTDLARRISNIYNNVRDSEPAKKLKKDIMKYKGLLEKLGIEDSDLKEINLNYNILIKKFIWSLLLLLINLIFSIPLIIILPLVKISKDKAEEERTKALERNPNKFEAKDVVSSVKVVTFAKYLPIFGIIWSFLLYLLLKFYFLKTYNFFFLIISCAICFMIYGYISITTIDSLNYHFEILKTIFYFFVVPKGIDNLKDMRKRLSKTTFDFINDNIKGTQYENETDRIINFKNKKKFNSKFQINL